MVGLLGFADVGLDRSVVYSAFSRLEALYLYAVI